VLKRWCEIDLVPAYVGKSYFGANTDTSCGVGNHCGTVKSIYPLTKDKDLLKQRIDAQTGGSTAGQLGTAWPWYLLSPKWNSVLQMAFPAANDAGSYSVEV
jgi:hypothetical protein